MRWRTLSTSCPNLHREAGNNVAEHYGNRFGAATERITEFPESAAARPDLGQNARISVVPPYILIYDYLPDDGLVVLLRILHGHRDVTARMLNR